MQNKKHIKELKKVITVLKVEMIHSLTQPLHPSTETQSNTPLVEWSEY